MDLAAFVATIARAGSMTQEEATRAARATLETLGERISPGEAEDVARRLPEELRPTLRSDGGPQAFGADEFIRRVAEREGTDERTARTHAEAVFAALGSVLSEKELSDVDSELPGDYDFLRNAAESRPPLVVGQAQPRWTADEFVQRVADRAGLDPQQARRATDAVLEALGDRITGGEVDDLEAELPQALHPPLERGKEESHGAARPVPLRDFLRRVAEREGVTPDEAREHARAVFATLREAVTEKEIADVEAQLPDEYAAVLALA
jgi:uncharacterized protein (DUF2267 family)